MNNPEINNLKIIMGFKHGVEYDARSVSQLRYGHIMIMTDQDHDGSHIKVRCDMYSTLYLGLVDQFRSPLLANFVKGPWFPTGVRYTDR